MNKLHKIMNDAVSDLCNIKVAKLRKYEVLANNLFVENYEQDGTSCAVKFTDGTIGRGHWGNCFVHIIDRPEDQVVLMLDGSYYIVSNEYTINKKDLTKLNRLIKKRKKANNPTLYRAVVNEINILKQSLHLN